MVKTAVVAKLEKGVITSAVKKKTVVPIVRTRKKDEEVRLEKIALCYLCKQTFGQIDRDAPPALKKKLRWVKKYWDQAGIEVAHGEECYECFRARRKY